MNSTVVTRSTFINTGVGSGRVHRVFWSRIRHDPLMGQVNHAIQDVQYANWLPNELSFIYKDLNYFRASIVSVLAPLLSQLRDAAASLFPLPFCVSIHLGWCNHSEHPAGALGCGHRSASSPNPSLDRGGTSAKAISAKASPRAPPPRWGDGSRKGERLFRKPPDHLFGFPSFPRQGAETCKEGARAH